MWSEEIREDFKDEVCYGCDVTLLGLKEFYDTAWLGIYWCGSLSCAGAIMMVWCDLIDPDEEKADG